MKYPLVSLIIPVYNVEKYILSCIESSFSIDYPNIEIIIVNDNTLDNSMEIVREYIKNKSRPEIHFKIINHNENKGLTAARETGLKAAEGKYIMFIDSDDYIINQNKFKELITIGESKNADIIVLGFRYDYGNGMFKTAFNIMPDNPAQYFYKVITRQVTCNIWGKIIRRDLFEKAQISFDYTIGMGEDYAIYPKLIYHSHVICNCSKEVLYNYNCSNQNSFTSKGITSKAMTSLITAIDSIYQFLQKNEISKSEQQKFININRVILLEKSNRKYWTYITELWPEIPFTTSGLTLNHKVFYYLYKSRLHRIAKILTLLR